MFGRLVQLDANPDSIHGLMLFLNNAVVVVVVPYNMSSTRWLLLCSSNYHLILL